MIKTKGTGIKRKFDEMNDNEIINNKSKKRMIKLISNPKPFIYQNKTKIVSFKNINYNNQMKLMNLIKKILLIILNFKDKD